MAEVKVIVHIDEIDKWSLVFKNVSNLLHAVDIEKSSIEVLANSEAVKFYAVGFGMDDDVRLMEELSKKGIKFIACNNSLNSCHIRIQDLMGFINIVPLGILELIKRQKEGYAYIKP